MGLLWIMNVVEDADAQYEQQKDYFVESMEALVRMVGGRTPLSPLPVNVKARKERKVADSRRSKLAKCDESKDRVNLGRCDDNKENWKEGRSELKRPLSTDGEAQGWSKRSKLQLSECREKQVESLVKRTSEAVGRQYGEAKQVLEVQEVHLELSHKRKLCVQEERTRKKCHDKGVEQVEEREKSPVCSRTANEQLVVPDSPPAPDQRTVNMVLTCSKYFQRGSGYDSICLERYNFGDELQGLEGGKAEAQNSNVQGDVPSTVSKTFELHQQCDDKSLDVVYHDAEQTLEKGDCDEKLQESGKRSDSVRKFRTSADRYITEEDGAIEKPNDINVQEDDTNKRQRDDESRREDYEQRLEEEIADDDCDFEQLQQRSEFRTPSDFPDTFTPREDNHGNYEPQASEVQRIVDSEGQEHKDFQLQHAEPSAELELEDSPEDSEEAIQEQGPRETVADSEDEANDDDQHELGSPYIEATDDAFECGTEVDGYKELRQGNADVILVETEDDEKLDDRTVLQEDVPHAEAQNDDQEYSASEERLDSEAVAGFNDAEKDDEQENRYVEEELLEVRAVAGDDKLLGEDSCKNTPVAERNYDIIGQGDYKEREAPLENVEDETDIEQQHSSYPGCLSFDGFEDDNQKKVDRKDSKIQEDEQEEEQEEEEEEEEEKDDEADAGIDELILQVVKHRDWSFMDLNSHQQSEPGDWDDQPEYDDAFPTSEEKGRPQRMDSIEEQCRVQQDERLEKTSKSNNLVSNMKSFLPLVVPQQPAVSYANGKKDVRVKALEAAEAARKQEEKRAEERKARKLELLNRQKSLPAGVSARYKKVDSKKLEREQRKKDEECKRKEAELRKREDKRKKVDDVLRMKKEHEERLRVELEEKEQRRKAMEEALLSKKAMEDEQKRQKRLEKEKEIERRRKADEDAKASWLANKEADRKRREEAFQRMKALEREQRRHADKAELVAATATQDIHEVERPSRLSTLRPGTILQREKSLGLLGHATRIPTGGSAPRKAASLNQLRNSFNAKHSLNGTEFFSGTPAVKKSLDQRYCTPFADELVVDEEDDEDDDGPITYDISPYKDDDDESDEEEEDMDDENAEKRPSKPIPRWAWKDKLLPQLVRQAQIDPDRIFKSAKSCSLSEVFGTTGNRRRGDFSQRSGSGDWSMDIASWKEELQYKKSMGYL